MSEDNNSSVNSTSEQSSIYSSDSSPNRSIIHGPNGLYPAPQNLTTNGRGKSSTVSSIHTPPKSPVIVEFKPVMGYNGPAVSYAGNGSVPSPPTSTWSSGAPLHFHKKYLREEHMKQIKQEMDTSDEPQNLSSPVNYR